MKWAKGDVVMVDWNGCFYKAKIIGVSESDGETHYKIHYDSWSSKWDQVIPESKTEKWKAFTAEAEKAAREQIKGLKTGSKGRKRDAADSGESDAAPSKKKEGEEQSPRIDLPDPESEAAPSKKKEGEEQSPGLDLPERLQNMLLDDFTKMTTSGLYVAMPTKVTVREIIQEFCAKIAASDEEEMTVEVRYADGKKAIKKTTKHEFTAFAHMMERLINSLFTCISVQQDKQQFRRLEEEFLKKNQENNDDLMQPFAPSKHFGVMYLLRLFAKVNGGFKLIDASDRYSFFKHSSDFMKHLLDNIDNYYDKDAYSKTDGADRSTA